MEQSNRLLNLKELKREQHGRQEGHGAGGTEDVNCRRRAVTANAREPCRPQTDKAPSEAVRSARKRRHLIISCLQRMHLRKPQKR